MKTAALLAALALTGCGKVTPETFALAEKHCASYGGVIQAEQYEHGKGFVIVCKDQTRIDIRPGAAQ